MGLNGRLEGSLGAATSGGVQGRILGGLEVVSYGHDCDEYQGWQWRGMMGGRPTGVTQEATGIKELRAGYNARKVDIADPVPLCDRWRIARCKRGPHDIVTRRPYLCIASTGHRRTLRVTVVLTRL